MVMQMVLSLLMPHEIHPVKKHNKTTVGVEMEKKGSCPGWIKLFIPSGNKSYLYPLLHLYGLYFTMCIYLFLYFLYFPLPLNRYEYKYIKD